MLFEDSRENWSNHYIFSLLSINLNHQQTKKICNVEWGTNISYETMRGLSENPVTLLLDLQFSILSYKVIVLMLKLFIIIISYSCGERKKFLPGWFGMRKDFCSFILGVFPCLQEYANISYYPERRQEGVELEQTEKMDLAYLKRADLLKPVLPIISIETPDWFSEKDKNGVAGQREKADLAYLITVDLLMPALPFISIETPVWLLGLRGYLSASNIFNNLWII